MGLLSTILPSSQWTCPQHRAKIITSIVELADEPLDKSTRPTHSILQSIATDSRAGNIYSRSTVDSTLNPFRSECTTTAIPRRIRQSTRNRFFPFGFFTSAPVQTSIFSIFSTSATHLLHGRHHACALLHQRLRRRIHSFSSPETAFDAGRRRHLAVADPLRGRFPSISSIPQGLVLNHHSFKGIRYIPDGSDG